MNNLYLYDKVYGSKRRISYIIESICNYAKAIGAKTIAEVVAEDDI